MSALVVLVVAMLAGVFVARVHRVPSDAHRVVDLWVLEIALPALAFGALHKAEIPPGVLYAVAAPWLLFGLTAAIFFALGRYLGWRRDVIGAVILTTGLANTSFVGFPMVNAFFGADALPTAILVDQLGSFLIVSTVGVAFATVMAGNRVSAGPMLVKIITTPLFLAVAAAFLLRPFTFPTVLDEALVALGATVTPLALFSIGLQLRITDVRRWRAPLVSGLLVKLLIAPAVIVAFYAAFGVLDREPFQVAMFEIAMPPMVAGAILAVRAGLASTLPSLMVGIGVPLSFLTLPAWSWFLQR